MASTRPLRVLVLLIPMVLAAILPVSRAGSRSLDPKQLATLECNQNAAAWTTRTLASGREYRIVSNSGLDRDYGPGVLAVEYLTEFNVRSENCAFQWQAWDLLNELKPEAEARGDDRILVMATNERIGWGEGYSIERLGGNWDGSRSFRSGDGPDCMIVGPTGREPEDLFVAILSEDVPRARALLAQNHDVEDAEGSACGHAHVDCEAGGIMAGLCGITPLSFAASIGDPDMVELLLQAGANVNSVAPCGTTPAGAAALHGHADIFRMLVRRGADLEIRNQQGETAIMRAAGSANGSAVRLLLEAGADPNVSDDSGRTPLMHALLRKTDYRPTAESADCYRRIMRVLVSAGADPKARDHDGKTVRDLARENGDAEDTIFEKALRAFAETLDHLSHITGLP